MDKLLTQKEVASILGVSLSTLEKWRKKNTGPEFKRVGRQIRYHPNDVEKWIND